MNNLVSLLLNMQCARTREKEKKSENTREVKKCYDTYSPLLSRPPPPRAPDNTPVIYAPASTTPLYSEKTYRLFSISISSRFD